MRMPRQSAMIALGDTMTTANFTDGLKAWSQPAAALDQIKQAFAGGGISSFTAGVIAVPAAVIGLLLMLNRR